MCYTSFHVGMPDGQPAGSGTAGTMILSWQELGDLE